ncbi:SNF2-related protein [Paenibacillus lautus]|uniref:SNF2-related protein n=1 Tax=Paenibacillus lautus TaxID=1401 RepID=UPI000FD972D1|nr:DEAD/DEAH box helicase [Paenibacillus lautus]
MTDNQFPYIKISYNKDNLSGIFSFQEDVADGVLLRMRQFAMSVDSDFIYREGNILELSWSGTLRIVKEFAPLQRNLGFMFTAEGQAKERIATFLAQLKEVNKARNTLSVTISEQELDERLLSLGFTKRKLTPEQSRDACRLLSLHNGANFSVPGAGKTTVTFAVHLLTKSLDSHLLVIGPKSAFLAWQDVINDCMDDNAPNNNSEPFQILTDVDKIQDQLLSGAKRFIISYDLMIRVPQIITNYLGNNPVHVILDESHRMKAGFGSQRGTFLLNVAALPIRRDILSGTPMPQGANDLQSQLDFLWPGVGLGNRISMGDTPRTVLGNLYVRTTKKELGLKSPNRYFEHVDMSKGQLALYTILRNEAMAQLTQFRQDRRIDVARARRSIMRLLQVSTNPVVALDAIVQDLPRNEAPAIARIIREEGPSPKILRAAELVRELASQNRKSIIWTIFTNTITQLESLLVDLNPLSLHGEVPNGDKSDLATREGRIYKFHTDPNYKVIIANPAAVSEGISLHKVCHEAIYVDRSYNATHFLQSIDRIHRLGLDPEVETNIHILQTVAPLGLGSVDHSVSRRLATKIRAMQDLLNDIDLHEIALAEESADEPIDYDIRPEDLEDLLDELEGRTSFMMEEADWLDDDGIES